MDYFTQIDEWRADIAAINSSKYVADFEDILDLQLDGITYPLMVSEIPDIIVQEESHWQYESAIAILKPISPTAYTEDLLKSTLSETLTIVRKLIHQMHDCDQVQYISNINPITKATPEHLYGWRFLFRMTYTETS